MVRGQKRTIKSPNTLDVQASIHNRFDVEVVDVATGKVKQTAQALNVICEGLWTRLFEPAKYFNYIFYGDGTGTPSTSDTSLFSHIGHAAVENVTYGVDYSTGVYYRKGSIQLSAATAAGKTISEVGIAYGSKTTNLCTHAMLKDMNGNPISIEKTDTDVINIYATIFVHFERLGYDNNTIFILQQNNVGYVGEYAASDVLTWISGAFHAIPDRAFWSQGDTFRYRKSYYSGRLSPYSATGVDISYAADKTNRRATFTFARLESSTGNYDQGLNHVSIGSPKYNGGPISRFVPAVLVYPGGASHPYSVVEGEAVATGDGTTKDFALDFAFPRDAKVYVDGVETLDFTLDYAPNTANWLNYVKGIRPESREGEIIPLPQNSVDFYGGQVVVFYNPMWEIGISAIRVDYVEAKCVSISASDDNVIWDDLTITPTGSFMSHDYAIPGEYAHKKFWKMTSTSTSDSTCVSGIIPLSPFNGQCLHLGTPPPEGAVITADYKCDCFAKDANHVLDMSVTFQFNEYTE